MFSSPNATLRRSLLAAAAGVIALAWPGVTVGAFVTLFTIYTFLAAATDGARAFSGDRAGPVLGWLLLALFSVAAGTVALSWRGITALALMTLVGAWALATGVLEIIMALRRGIEPGRQVLFVLSGLVSAMLAFTLFARPDTGAVSLATVFGLFSIFYGVSGAFTSAEERRILKGSARVNPARPSTPGGHEP